MSERTSGSCAMTVSRSSPLSASTCASSRVTASRTRASVDASFFSADAMPVNHPLAPAGSSWSAHQTRSASMLVTVDRRVRHATPADPLVDPSVGSVEQPANARTSTAPAMTAALLERVPALMRSPLVRSDALRRSYEAVSRSARGAAAAVRARGLLERPRCRFYLQRAAGALSASPAAVFPLGLDRSVGTVRVLEKSVREAAVGAAIDRCPDFGPHGVDTNRRGVSRRLRMSGCSCRSCPAGS